MNAKKVLITISALGGSKVETEGFKGETCKDATKLIEQALSEGTGKTTVELKEEWFQKEDNEQHEEVGQSW